MDYRQCLIFYTAAEELSFTKAAEKLFLTQSAVSHAIKGLEEEAGLLLFERLHRGIRLTSAGEAFLPEVKSLLRRFQQAENKLHQLDRLTPIRLASCITFAEIRLPALLKAFKETHPNQRVITEILPAQECFRRLANGEADLALLEGQVPAGNFSQQVIASYPLVVVAAPTFPQNQLTLSQLISEELLLRERGSAVRETFEAYLTLQGKRSNPVSESSDSASLIAAASHGLGISILPRPLVAAALASGELKELDIPEMKLENAITALRNKNEQDSPQVQQLWDLIVTKESAG